MGTKINSNYSDLLTFTRASKGHALRPVSYGDDLFDSDTSNWSRGVFSVDGTLVYSANQLTHTLGSGDTSGARWVLPITCVVGEVLRLTVDSVAIGNGATSGGIGITANSNGSGYSDDVSISAGGTEVRVPATATTMYLTITTSGSSGATTTVTNVTVKKAIFDQPDGTLTLFEHPDNVPRVEWDADRNRLGLLVEESRTNNITNSESCNFVDESGGTVTASTTPAPYGTSSTVKRVQSSTLNGGGRLQVTILTGGDNYCSVYVRSRTGADQNLKITASGTTGATQVAPASGDWVRLGRVASLGAGSRDIRVLSTGDTIDLDIALPQVEFGSFPTSYMKTTGSTAIRSADVASIPVADFGYNQSAGTFFVEAEVFSTAITNAGDLALADAAGTPDMATGSRSGSSAEGYYSVWFRESNNTQAYLNEGPVITNNTTYKAAFCYKTNDFASSVDGNTVITDSSGTVPTRNDLLLIGSNYYGKLNGHIKSIKYYPRRLSDAQLQDLTS